MTPQLRTKILQAHADSSLFGLFIDVQNFYCTTQSAHDAFTHINAASGQLETLGAQNIWAVWPTASESHAPEKGTLGEFNLYGKDAFAIAQPSASDVIYTKHSQNLRENKNIQKRHRQTRKPRFPHRRCDIRFVYTRYDRRHRRRIRNRARNCFKSNHHPKTTGLVPTI